jgi:hypothetical protein
LKTFIFVQTIDNDKYIDRGEKSIIQRDKRIHAIPLIFSLL